MTRTTYQEHARHMRKVVNLDSGTGRKILCAFSDCERDGYENFKRVQHEHARRGVVEHYGPVQGDSMCEAVDAGVFPGLHRTFVYCSERHRAMDHFGAQPQMQESRGGIYGYLPTGWRGMS